MDKNKIFNIGKDFAKDLTSKILQQGKETAKEAVNDFINQKKDEFTKTATQKINTFTGAKFSSTSEKTENIKESTEETVVKENIIITEQTKSKPINAGFDESKYLDADRYEQNVQNDLLGIAKGLASKNPKEALESFNNLVNMAGDVTKFTEVQKTKRKTIEAQRDIIVSNIQSQKEIILSYLEKSFDERKENFSKFFAVVDHAIANNNMEQLAMGMNAINNLAASSPFKDLASIESTQKALTNSNHMWDF